MQSHQQSIAVLKSKSKENGNRNIVLNTTAPFIHRGMTTEECRTICTSSIIPIREKAFFRMVYETQLRPFEALNMRIENLNKITGELVALRTKGKHNRWSGKTYELPRHVFVTQNTLEMLKTIISNRKRGYVFEGRVKGKPISKRYMQDQIDRYARLLSIQQLKQYTEDGREIPLITLMALRKAGERHHDANGGDASLSAQASGHNMRTKVQYYQNEVDWEAVHKSYMTHHPSFVEEW
jgi:integrase